jgi:hypothetical protein
MNNLSFVWTAKTPLKTELCKPATRASLLFDHGMPMCLTLWRADGTGLKMFSQMHDVAERTEIGVLNFERTMAPLDFETFVDLPQTFRCEVAASKLVIRESGTSAESGVVLRVSDGEEVMVVAGAYPYSIAVLGVMSVPHIFEPEYNIDRYVRVPME